MSFDFKKEYKEFYLPPKKPQIIEVPAMNFVAVRGSGDPNSSDGAYQKAIGILYGIAFTLRMSYKGDHQIEGYFSYVVPPLEGFWWMEGLDGIDYSHKENFTWISMIRLPDFVTEEDFQWAVETAAEKKQSDFSAAEFLRVKEGLCAQCMHTGPYDDEPATLEKLHQFIADQGYAVDITEERFHHEIYISDVRKCKPEKLRTVLRLPIKKQG